jgi:hypothetical protein
VPRSGHPGFDVDGNDFLPRQAVMEER